jgi:heme A synthase
VAFWRGGEKETRVIGLSLAIVVAAQVLLGFLSVYYRLAAVPVSLHTLLAAILLTLLVALATYTWIPYRDYETLE